MKRMLFFLITCFVGYIIYFDLTTGTLPKIAKEVTSLTKIEAAEPEKETSLSFHEVQIVPGDTLLSLFKKENLQLNQSLEKVISDFKLLNDGVNPEEIQIGKTYKLPVYPSAE